MTLLLVPHRATQDSATLWVGKVIPPGTVLPDIRLGVSSAAGQSEAVVRKGQWRWVNAEGYLNDAEYRVLVQVVKLQGLRAGTVYHISGPAGESARFSTMPASLPPPGERPFTLLLASCFHCDKDQEGLFARAVGALPEPYRPDLKILSGDQVYLDLPLSQNFPDDRKWLAGNFMKRYLKTWSQEGALRHVLAMGGTCCTADDHEFWNNYPNWTTLSSNTWSEGGRQRWAQIALSLYRDFQYDDPALVGRPRTLRAGRLSLFVAECRTYREPGEARFMRDDDLAALGAWVDGLDGPGVLVLGQPIFATASGWFHRKFYDRSLPNYAQYRDLARLLLGARRSIVVLTGDVHFGRVASCEVRGGARPVQIIEVISSPSSLVDSRVGGRAYDAPGRFPEQSLEGVVPVATRTHYKSAEENFATLGFSERAGRVTLSVRYWFHKTIKYGTTRFADVPPIDLE